MSGALVEEGHFRLKIRRTKEMKREGWTKGRMRLRKKDGSRR